MSNGEVRVSDDGERAFHQDVIDTLLHANPAYGPPFAGVGQAPVRVILERMAQTRSPDADTPLSAIGQSVLPYRRLAIDEVLQHLPQDAAVELFEQADVFDLFGRWALVPYLLSDPSLLTIAELADVLDEFAGHLEANRSSLITMGVPQSSLGASWPGTMLGYLYPTGSLYWESQTVADGPERVSPRDRALKHIPAAKASHTTFTPTRGFGGNRRRAARTWCWRAHARRWPGSRLWTSTPQHAWKLGDRSSSIWRSPCCAPWRKHSVPGMRRTFGPSL